MMSDRDRWWLTATVWMEAQGESDEGKLAVVFVLLNRMKRRGQSAGEVCLAPFQFSCWNTDSRTRHALATVNENSQSWLDVCSAVYLAVSEIKPDPTGGAMHYYNPTWAHPDWDHDRTLPRVKIGQHLFVRDVP